MLSNNELIEKLKEAPDDQLDFSMIELINKWNAPPTALQILEVLDRSVYSSLASKFVISVLELLFKSALERENLVITDLLSSATWRTENERN